MNEIVEQETINIEDMIYEVRGKQVMLDSDISKLFGYETKQLNRQVLRNKDRFPENFCFQLSNEEYLFLRCQNGTLKGNRGEHRKYLPYVFTEYGVTMLAGILRSNIAVEMSIKIVNTFVLMRKYISTGLIEQKYINNQVMKNTEDIRLLQESFNKLESKEVKNEIYFNGQIYDAYSKMMEIMSKTKKELIVIDGYADRTFLDMIKNFNFQIILITKTQTKLSKLDISKYESEYHNLTIIYDDSFHDRYFILDKEIIYHCGASLNYAGSKTFSINRLEDNIVAESLIKRINEILEN